jgi:hypothetical protein
MPIVALTRISVCAFMASCLLFAKQLPTTPAPPPQASEPGQQPTATPRAPRTPKEEAWKMLETACTGEKTSERATAIRVLGLVPNDAKARNLAEKALHDDRAEVRSAAAAALGDINSRTSIRKLREGIGRQGCIRCPGSRPLSRIDA